MSAPPVDPRLPATEWILVHGPLVADGGAPVLGRLAALEGPERVLLDLSGTRRIDDAGLCAIACIHDRLAEGGGALHVRTGRHTRSAVDLLRAALGETLVVLDHGARREGQPGAVPISRSRPVSGSKTKPRT